MPCRAKFPASANVGLYKSAATLEPDSEDKDMRSKELRVQQRLKQSTERRAMKVPWKIQEEKKSKGRSFNRDNREKESFC